MAAAPAPLKGGTIMDYTTKLIEFAFSKPYELREILLKEIPNLVVVPDYEEKLILYLYTHATQEAREMATRILRQPQLLSAFQELHSDIA